VALRRVLIFYATVLVRLQAALQKGLQKFQCCGKAQWLAVFSAALSTKAVENSVSCLGTGDSVLVMARLRSRWSKFDQ
jgi:hypothetical protein